MKKKQSKHTVKPVKSAGPSADIASEKKPSIENCRLLLNRGHYTKAFSQLQQLAGEENPEAEYLLSLLYDRGDGTAVDHQKAADWLKKSAVSGYPEQQGLRLRGMRQISGEGRISQSSAGNAGTWQTVFYRPRC